MRNNVEVSGLGYLGGKSAGSRAGKWVAGLLPWEQKTLYAEPFAGMLGVLLQRAPVDRELVNDRNGRVTNWWRVMRDRPAEMHSLWMDTPYGRDNFEEAVSRLDTADELTRAWAFQVVVSHSMMHADNCHNFAIPYATKSRSASKEDSEEWYNAIAKRMRHVVIDNRCALDVLGAISKYEDAVVYADPPYPTTQSANQNYAENELDWDVLAGALQAQKGRVAVSGYADEWDRLGWHKHERTVAAAAGGTPQGERGMITQVVWCNYEIGGRLFCGQGNENHS